MIERELLRMDAQPIFIRFSESLFSLDIKAITSGFALRKYELCFNARVRGKSIAKSYDVENEDHMAWDMGRILTSGHGALAEQVDDVHLSAFRHIRSYLSTMRVVMEGKQGIIGFDLLSLSDTHMMELFEKAAEEVFGRASETIVIYQLLSGYIPNNEARARAWDAYMDYKGIFFEDDWMIGC